VTNFFFLLCSLLRPRWHNLPQAGAGCVTFTLSVISPFLLQLSADYFCCFLIDEWLKFSRKFIRVLDRLSLTNYPKKMHSFGTTCPALPYLFHCVQMSVRLSFPLKLCKTTDVLVKVELYYLIHIFPPAALKLWYMYFVYIQTNSVRVFTSVSAPSKSLASTRSLSALYKWHVIAQDEVCVLLAHCVHWTESWQKPITDK
jgi:hypothetical protein